MSRVAAVQMCSGISVEGNLEQANKWIERAAAKGAALAVLPEMFPIISNKPQDKIRYQENFRSGKIQDFLAETALRNKIWIVGGTLPISTKTKNQVRAASLLFNDKGEQVARYDKIHLFDVDLENQETHQESATTEPGNECIVAQTPIGKIGMAVCYDLRFPALFNHLSHLGAEIFVVPSAFTVPTGSAHWHLLMRARAVENFCYSIGASQAGLHESGRRTYGHSLIVDPWGTIMAEQINDEPGVIVADIDLHYLKKVRHSIPIDKHHKIFPNLKNL